MDRNNPDELVPGTYRSEVTHPSRRPPRRGLADKIESAAWGLLFIWLGVVWMTDLRVGVALLGVSAIVLGEQLARWAGRLVVKGFWIFVGICLALAGVWNLLGATLDLAPLLLILAGASLLLKLLKRTPTQPA